MTPLLHDPSALTNGRIPVSEMDNKIHVLTTKSGGEHVLIDAADNSTQLGIC